MSRLRIGINGLYLIPGGVGGTETYLRNLLKALAELDSENLYFVYVARDAADVVPDQANFAVRPQLPFNRFRPIRLLWEQTVLPLQALADRLGECHRVA